MATTHQRTRGRRLVALALAVLVLSLGGASAAAARPQRPEAVTGEARFLTLVNQARREHGLAPLAADSALAADARAWSAVMAAEHRLHHAPRDRMVAEANRSVPGWRRLGENVGRGWDVEGLDAAFWASAPHRANVVGEYDRVGVGVVQTATDTWVTFRFASGPPRPAPGAVAGPDGDLWLADVTGRVFAVGAARHHGDARALALSRPVVGMVSSAGRGGYWLLAADGGVFSYGDARFHGSTGAMRLNRPINGMAATPSGQGYFLVASDGGVFAFGDARFVGSTGHLRLNRPITAMAVTPTGAGYWLVASDGGIFAFGDARFHGSAADGGLGAPVVGIAPTPSGNGYWLAAANGRVGAYGDAVHHGDRSVGTTSPVARIQAAPDGRGYWLVSGDGSVVPFGSAGARAGGPLTNSGIVAVASAR
jgi:hypothetical protein